MTEQSIPLSAKHIRTFKVGDHHILQAVRKLPFHPALGERRMLCRRIIRIEVSVRGTFVVEYQEDRKDGRIVTKECTSIFGIKNEKHGVSFGFIKYHSEKRRRRLMKEYKSGVYDDIPLNES